MKLKTKGLLLASVHLAFILILGGKFLVDRATRPRFWLKTAPVDPDLPIRGRYVSLRVEVPVRGAELPPTPSTQALEKSPWLRQNRFPITVKLESTPNGWCATMLPSTPKMGWESRGEDWSPDVWPDHVAGTLIESLRTLPKDQWTVQLNDTLAFFIPEQVPDPSRRAPGEELWVEVTLPRKGPLRPIRLGVKKDGKLTPMVL